MGKERKEERTYHESTARSCHPVGEANLLKIWEFSRCKVSRSKVKIHLLGRFRHAGERDDGDAASIVGESGVHRDIVKGDRRSSEWLTLAISVCGTTQEVVGRIAGATLEILLLPTSHLLGAEEGVVTTARRLIMENLFPIVKYQSRCRCSSWWVVAVADVVAVTFVVCVCCCCCCCSLRLFTCCSKCVFMVLRERKRFVT